MCFFVLESIRVCPIDTVSMQKYGDQTIVFALLEAFCKYRYTIHGSSGCLFPGNQILGLGRVVESFWFPRVGEADHLLPKCSMYVVTTYPAMSP